MTEQFNIPVVLLIFKRKDKLTQIMSRVSQVKPKKIYIIADGARDDSEKEAVLECRTWLESLIGFVGLTILKIIRLQMAQAMYLPNTSCLVDGHLGLTSS